MADQKVNLDKLAIVRFFNAFKRYKKRTIGALILIPISVAVVICVPYLTILIIDEHFTTSNTNGLVQLITIYSLVFVTGYICDSLYTIFLQTASNNVLRDVSNDLFSHVLKLPQVYFDKTSNGITMSRLTTDFETIGDSLSQGGLDLFVALLKISVLSVFLIVVSYQLSMVFIILIPVIFLITQYLRLKLRKYYELSRHSLASSISYLNECLQGMKTVLLLNAQDYTKEKYAAYNRDFLKYKSKENIFEALLYSLIDGLSIISVVIVLFLGSKYVLAGALSMGILVAFYQSLLKIFVPIREFTQQYTTIQRAFASMSGIERLFRREIDPDVSISNKDFKFQSLEFKNVFFKYDDDQPYALKDVSFKLNRLEKIAFVGRTGSGKTTIIKLLQKKYLNYQGEILLNGQELKYYSKSDIYNLLNIMNQDVFLFNDTLRFNLKMEAANLSDDYIKDSINQISSKSYLDSLSGGLDFVIQENGKNISVGEAQILGLTRSKIRDKELFILDEATAAIDSITENYIEKALKDIFSQKTVIAIAHRLSTIQNSDRIFLMSHGEIIEQGSHKELMAKKGDYFILASGSKQSSKQKVEVLL